MSERDQRRYRRVALSLPARVTVNAIDDYAARTLAASPGNLAFETEADVAVGDAVVASVQRLDFIEGRVARLLPNGFAMSFRLPQNRRRLLTERLMLHVNGDVAADLVDRRAAPRHQEGDKRTICRLPNGGSLLVKVLNRSVDGVAVEAPRKPEVGSPILVGRQRGVVLRHTPRGFVVIFDPVDQANGAGADAPAPRLRAV